MVAEAGLAPAAGIAALAGTATLTTTFHRPFYDKTQAAFVEAVDLHTATNCKPRPAPPSSKPSGPTTPPKHLRPHAGDEAGQAGRGAGKEPGEEPEPWPGVPVRGRNAAVRAELRWLPIARGLTPHGLRHTYKTTMVELGTPPTLMDDQMGHSDGSVQANYAHATAEMRQRLIDGLTAVWQAALDARRRLSPGSPVAVLDRLLRACEEEWK
jgi:hypothetical protein